MANCVVQLDFTPGTNPVTLSPMLGESTFSPVLSFAFVAKFISELGPPTWPQGGASAERDDDATSSSQPSVPAAPEALRRGSSGWPSSSAQLLRLLPGQQEAFVTFWQVAIHNLEIAASVSDHALAAPSHVSRRQVNAVYEVHVLTGRQI